MDRKEYLTGVKDSLPVGIGYFAVSFGFGVAAVQVVNIFEATLMSLTNLTSAGQFAAIKVVASASSLWVMLLTQLVINSRYALMSLALGQRLGNNFGLLQRMLIAFINTDEIFALAMQRPFPLTVSYMYGLGLTPILGWTGGTLLGALAGDILPTSVSTALGVALYGMFVAIVIPQVRESKPKLIATLLAAVLSSAFTWVPILKTLDSGLAIVVCTVAAAAICAAIFPLPDDADTKEDDE